MPSRLVRSAASCVVVAIVGFGAMILAGCTDRSALLTQSNAAGHVLLSDARHVEAVPGGTIEGTLTLVGSCFGLDTGTGDFVAVFPHGSEQVEDTDQVEIPGWGTLGLGNHYQGGGGILESRSLSYHDDIPAACRASHIAVLDPIR